MSTHYFEQRLAEAWDPRVWADVQVVVAVSGGPDSVALLRGLVHWAQRGQLLVAHYNHQLRGDESDADELFVGQLCHQLQVPCRTGRGPAATVAAGDGVEAAARQTRYDFLRDVSDTVGARYLVTAHTADDQVETILHRIVRGTGLAGLSGMPATRRLSELTAIRRPLLGLTRQDVLQYLRDMGQPYREDSSNRQMDFTRNWIRHQLLPLLADQLNPQVDRSLLRLGRLAGEAQEVIDLLVDPLVEAAVMRCSPSTVEICCLALSTAHPYLVREVLKRVWTSQRWPLQAMGGDKWQQLAALVCQQPDGAALTLPGNIQARRSGRTLLLVQC